MNMQFAIFLIVTLACICFFGVGSADEKLQGSGAISPASRVHGVGANGANHAKPLLVKPAPHERPVEKPHVRARRAHDKPPYLPRPTPPRPIH